MNRLAKLKYINCLNNMYYKFKWNKFVFINIPEKKVIKYSNFFLIIIYNKRNLIAY